MLRFIIALVVNLFRLVLAPLWLLRRVRAAPKGAWLEVEVDEGIVDISKKASWFDRRPRPLDLYALRRVLAVAGRDPRVRGILVTLRELRAGSAAARSFRDLLLFAKERNKKVVVYLPDGAHTRDYYVAAAADEIIASHDSQIAPVGFSIQAPYFGKFLPRHGIKAEVFAKGRYKTAAEPLVLDRMSRAQREQLEELLELGWETLVTAVSSGRKVSRERAESWISRAPFSSQRAKEEGLVDAVLHRDELGEHLAEGDQKAASLVPLARYARRKRRLWMRFFRPKLIGVLEVHGVIASNGSGPWPVASDGHFKASVERALADPRVVGVVAHINSRGGSALASRRMHRELERLGDKKPVVAYFADVAASGGYMIGTAAREIVAQPNTITGSIGVVAARWVVEPLLSKLSIHVDTLGRGEHAAIASPFRSLSESEHESVSREIDDVYQSFLGLVASGRKLEPEQVHKLAEGRVWSGAKAHQHRLLDHLGGFDLALERVRDKLGPGAEKLEPAVISGKQKVGHPLRWLRPAAHARETLPQLARVLGLVGHGDAWLLALGAPRDRALLYSPYVEGD